MYIDFQKGADNFKIEHKLCTFLVRGAVPPSENGLFSLTLFFLRYFFLARLLKGGAVILN